MCVYIHIDTHTVEDILLLMCLKASYQITSNSGEVSVFYPHVAEYFPFWTMLNPLS